MRELRRQEVLLRPICRWVKVFLDFDEMLAHSFYADSEKHADQLLEDYSEHWYGVKYHIRNDGWYVTFKRSWADDLIKFLNELVDKDNVYILTTGTLDYIRWANIKINLGFDPNTNTVSYTHLTLPTNREV